MKIIINIACICLFVFKYDYCLSQQISDGPYLGQKPPGTKPEVFAPGIISLPDRRETKIVFSPDGQQCFIMAGSLLYTKQQNGHWLLPDIAHFLGKGGAGEPFFSPNEQRFFFVRKADIWMSTISSEKWSKPIKLDKPINTEAEEWHPTVTLNGTIYFCSSRNNPSGKYNIYCSKLKDSKYVTIKRLDSIINSQYGAWDPFIASDESYLIFSSNRPNGYGRVDQYISFQNKDGSWSEPNNLGPTINTNAIEYGSYITFDGKYFFFSRSEGWGANVPSDIYWVDSKVILKQIK